MSKPTGEHTCGCRTPKQLTTARQITVCLGRYRAYLLLTLQKVIAENSFRPAFSWGQEHPFSSDNTRGVSQGGDREVTGGEGCCPCRAPSLPSPQTPRRRRTHLREGRQERAHAVSRVGSARGTGPGAARYWAALSKTSP